MGMRRTFLVLALGAATLLGAALAAPRLFRASAALFAPKASWFQAASAASGFASSAPRSTRSDLLVTERILSCGAPEYP